MVNVHMNGNWSDDNRKRKGGGKDQFTNNVLFSYPPESHAPIFKPHPKK